MENASKALIIAGAILLSILIISLGILIFSQAQDTINSVNMSEQEVMAFNNKFTPYEGDNVRGSQVNALVQAVVSNNQSAHENGEDRTKGITITGEVKVNSGEQNSPVTKVASGTFYKVSFEYKNSLVNRITITKNN